MFLGICALVALALVPLTGGRLKQLAELRLRWLPVAFAALVLQIIVISVWTTMPHAAAVAGHVVSYAMLGVVVWVNRRIPGMLLIGLGTGLNGLAITLNDGTLPASSWALRHSGIQVRPGFNNSGVLAHPHLAWLGDIMVTPSWLPFRNMISIGDLVLLIGAIVLVMCASRPVNDDASLPQSSSAMNIREPAGAI